MKRQTKSPNGRPPRTASRERGHQAQRLVPSKPRHALSLSAAPRPPSPAKRGRTSNPESNLDKINFDIAVDRFSPLWAALPEAEALAERAILASAASCGVPLRRDAEVGVQLVEDAQIRALNARWRGLDKPTNVLSFPAAPVEKFAVSPLLGDIVIAFETVRREADEARISLADHFVHLVVHGFLHLVGFDHQGDDEADRMEALETSILAEMVLADPYALDLVAERE
jgi:probable rRNA maturation factor